MQYIHLKIEKGIDIRDLLETDVDEKYYYGPDKYMYKELKATMKNPETAYQWRRIYVRENQSNFCSH